MKMAAFYEEGWGVEENQRRAASLYRRCCRKGTSLGCHYLAAMYEEGRGTAKNKGKAVEYYQKACSGGVAVSCKAVERLEVE